MSFSFHWLDKKDHQVSLSSNELYSVSIKLWRKTFNVCCWCSNFNYKPQVESRQQHFALYTDGHLCSVAIVREVTSRHKKCTHFNLDYRQMSCRSTTMVTPTKKLHLARCSWTAASSVKQPKPSTSRRALTSRPPFN